MLLAKVCLVLLGGLLAFMAAVKLAPCLRAFRMAWFTIAAIVLAAWAVPKPDWVFQLGVHNAGSTFDATNGVATVRWTYDADVLEEMLVVQYRIGRTGSWTELPLVPVRDCYAEFAVPGVDPDGDETVYFRCYTRHVAPPIVTTNGVYHVRGIVPAMESEPGTKYVSTGLPIRMQDEDGELVNVAPPADPPQEPEGGFLLDALLDNPNNTEE